MLSIISEINTTKKNTHFHLFANCRYFLKFSLTSTFSFLILAKFIYHLSLYLQCQNRRQSFPPNLPLSMEKKMKKTSRMKTPQKTTTFPKISNLYLASYSALYFK